MYDREELDTLLAAGGADERLWLEFFLMTGMREQEVMYCYWSDVNRFGADSSRYPRARQRLAAESVPGTRNSDC